MKFVLNIDLDKIDGDPATELGRALRYWGGATKQLDLTKVQLMDIMDSSYTEPIGYWEIRGEDEPDVTGNQHENV